MAKKKKQERPTIEVVDELNDEDFFDDCPVCQAMKFAKERGRWPTMSELLKAMEKAKKQGAVVGGKWFEKSDQSESAH